MLKEKVIIFMKLNLINCALLISTYSGVDLRICNIVLHVFILIICVWIEARISWKVTHKSLYTFVSLILSFWVILEWMFGWNTLAFAENSFQQHFDSITPQSQYHESQDILDIHGHASCKMHLLFVWMCAGICIRMYI